MAQEIVFPTGEAPKKLENFLKKRFPIGYVRKLWRRSAVRLNGQKAKPDSLIGPGDRLELYIPFEAKGRKTPPRVSCLRAVFEDARLLVIDKPAGLAVHEGKNILKRDTILGILESRYRSQGVTPRLVHRLDQDTSGLLLVAKEQDTARDLESAFEQGEIEKEYLCLVAGRISESEGAIDFPLPGREGKTVRAFTRFKVAKRFSTTTLVSVRLDTGRMHQIRLHFAKLGYPVVMDDRHGDFAFNRSFRKTYGLKRQFLHATKIALTYEGRKRVWKAPLPQDLERVLEALESNKPG